MKFYLKYSIPVQSVSAIAWVFDSCKSITISGASLHAIWTVYTHVHGHHVHQNDQCAAGSHLTYTVHDTWNGCPRALGNACCAASLTSAVVRVVKSFRSLCFPDEIKTLCCSSLVMAITIPDPFLLWLVWFDSVMPSLYPIYCYSRYRFTRYFDNGKTCFDCDFLKFHRYNRYILTTGHFIADTDCTRTKVVGIRYVRCMYPYLVAPIYLCTSKCVTTGKIKWRLLRGKIVAIIIDRRKFQKYGATHSLQASLLSHTCQVSVLEYHQLSAGTCNDTMLSKHTIHCPTAPESYSRHESHTAHTNSPCLPRQSPSHQRGAGWIDGHAL